SRCLRALVPLAAVLALAGCGDNRTSSLNPHSHPARDIASLWWWMMIGAWIGFGVVTLILIAAWIRRRGASGSERLGWGTVLAGGIALPIALLATLFVVSDIFVIRTTQAPAAS